MTNQNRQQRTKGAKNLLRGRATAKDSKLLIEAIDEVRANASPIGIPNLVSWMKQVPALRKRALRKVPIRQLRELHDVQPYQEQDLPRELAWAALLLHNGQDALRPYLRTRERIARNFPQNNYLDSLDALEELETVSGHSLWIIENRIGLLQLANGTETQREYVNKLRSNSPRCFASFLAYHTGRRNDDSTPMHHFHTRTLANLKRWSLGQDLSDYIAFRLLGELPAEPQRLAGVLRHEQTTSLIDLYETFLAVCAALASSGEIPVRQSVASATDLLSDVADFRLARLRFAASRETFPLFAAHATADESMLHELSGNREAAIAAANEALAKDPLDSLALIDWATAASKLRKPSDLNASNAIERAIGYAANALAMRPETERAIAELKRLALNNRGAHQLVGLYSFARLKLPSTPRNREHLQTQLLCNTPTIGIQLAECWETDDSQSLLNTYAENGGSERLINLVKFRQGKDNTPNAIMPTLSSAARDTANAQGALARGDTNAAVTHAQQILGSDNDSERLQGTLLLYEALLSDGDIARAVDAAAALIANQQYLRALLPLQSLFKNREFKALKQHCAQISFPIVCDALYFQTGQESDRNHLRWACDEFFHRNNISRPAEIVQGNEKFPRSQLIYFLERVCVIPVLQAWRKIRTSRASEEERLNVLSALASLSQDGGERYREEITDLEAKLQVDAGLRIVEKSRIFVDMPEIAKIARRNLRETYELFRTIRGTGSENADAKFGEALLELANGSKNLPTEYLQLPGDDADSLLIELVESLRREFYVNPDHGLEKFLSMRIRHGTLSGTLRGPLDERGLASSRNGDSSTYRPNAVWIGRVQSEISQHQAKLVGDVLAKLTERHDNLVENRIRPMIKVALDKNATGSLGRPLAPVIFHLFRREAQLAPDFDTFISSAFQILQSILGQELQLLCVEIKQLYEREVERAFLQAEERLAQIPDCESMRRLHTELIAAKTATHGTLRTVLDWLTIEKMEAVERAYTIQQVVAIGIASARRALRAFPFKEKVQTVGTARFGATIVRAVADVLFIAIDNAFKHSGLEAPRVEISIAHSATDRKLHITIKSESATTQYEATRRATEEVRKLLETEHYRTRAMSEGRSGLSKLKLITSKGCSEFGFESQRLFFVRAELPCFLLESTKTIETSSD